MNASTGSDVSRQFRPQDHSCSSAHTPTGETSLQTSHPAAAPGTPAQSEKQAEYIWREGKSASVPLAQEFRTEPIVTLLWSKRCCHQKRRQISVHHSSQFYREEWVYQIVEW